MKIMNTILFHGWETPFQICHINGENVEIEVFHMYKKLSRNFYRKNAKILAKDLLGKYLFHNIKNDILVGKIVETEAYMGYHDKGAHTYKGRRTKRTEAMYGEPGHAYIYLIYGMYDCINVVAAAKDIGQAVLIRALEPIMGQETMSSNRYSQPLKDLNTKQLKNLTNGPGKLCRAFGITRELYYEDFTGDNLYICEKKNDGEFEIIESKRVGIDYAEEAKDYLWRFYIKNNVYVSRL